MHLKGKILIFREEAERIDHQQISINKNINKRNSLHRRKMIPDGNLDIHKEIKSICPFKYLYINVHSSFICNKLKTRKKPDVHWQVNG